MKDYLIELVSKVSGDNQKLNMMREYLQVYALRTIFETGRFAQLSFVGGTALRFVFGLPRFSEDLDFSLTNDRGYDFEQILTAIKKAFQDANYDLNISYKQEKNVQTAMLKFPELMHLVKLTHRKEQNLSIKIDVDSKPPAGGRVVNTLVNKYYPITISHYDLASLFAGKLHAIFTRPYVKGRDYFDLVWLVSRDRNLNPNIELLNSALKQTTAGFTVTIDNWKVKVLEKIDSVDWKKIVEDVNRFSEDPLFINSMKPEFARALFEK
jgi:predicted nucleotidyltransferase component of viral defense system